MLLNKLLTLPKGGDALMPLSEFRYCSLDVHIDFNYETPKTTKSGAAQTPDCWQVALKVLELTLRDASCSIETAPSGWKQQRATLQQMPDNLLLLSVTMKDFVLYSSHC